MAWPFKRKVVCCLRCSWCHFKKLEFHCKSSYSKIHKNYCTYILDKMLMLIHMHTVNWEVFDDNIFKVESMKI